MTESVLPFLLAGPIIRRVDKTQVCIWIATSKPICTKVEIFKFRGSNSDLALGIDVDDQNDKELISHYSQSNLHIIGSGNSTSLKLGDNLFVSVIIARPFSNYEHNIANKTGLLNTFPTDEILAYDMEFFLSEERKEEGLRLKDLGLLSGENTILYDGSNSDEQTNHIERKDESLSSLFPLPTFFIHDRKNGSQLNFLYGSCRKLHGDDEDSLLIGDKILASSVSDLKKRPSSLFLLGDQIYADDVAGPLIGHLSRLSNELLGWREIVEGIDKNLQDIPIGGRKEIVTSKAQFTSEVSDNHLLGFGEFAAMYLVSWNPVIWPQEFGPNLANLNQTSESKQKHEKELEQLEETRRDLRKIRRLFANIPTYMICDDHEITDDWNIDRKWRDSVRNSICGSQIIVNGLVAYWAFQGWGNDPNSFDDNFIETIKMYLDLKKQKSLLYLDKTSRATNLNCDLEVNKMDKIRFLEDRIWNYGKWTYVAPTYPFSIFLDCRTQREFVNPDGPPVLLNDEALTNIKSEVYNAGYERGDPLIIISPTPVFGFEHAERVQRFLTSISGTYKWDLETWGANKMGFINFLTFMSDTFSPDYCVILSGDVHYAFTMRAKFDLFTNGDYQNQSTLDLRNNFQTLSSMPMAQLTASPLRSNSLTKRKLAIMILNLVHNILVSRKAISRIGLLEASYDQGYSNPRNSIESKEDNKLNNENPNYSKHGKEVSFFIKIKTILTSLINRYFVNKKRGNAKDIPNWRESRMLVRPKGHGTSPVLANNNIGSVSLNLESRTVEHTLFFLESNKVLSSVAKIQFDDTKQDIS